MSRSAVALALAVLVAGCSAPVPADPGVDAQATRGTGGDASPPPPNLDADVVGRENGYWYDDPIDVNLSDGLSGAEMEPYLARSMARVEHLRGHEFTRAIAIDVITRAALRERISETGSFASNETLSTREARIMNAFWEALFFVDEPGDARAVRASEGSAFLGAYYVFGTDTIRVVTDGEGPPIVGERLLIHELVHALQDEYAGTPLETRSDDDSYATTALIEGDAEVVERMYARRCESGRWECLSPPDRSGGEGAGDVHRGFRILRWFAYSDGPAFVYDLYRDGRFGRSGWDAVDHAFEVRPRTTEEIIHPDRYPADTDSELAPGVDPTNGWERLGGPYAVGELEVFGMFWYQDPGYGIEVIESDTFYEADRERYDWYNYTSAPSEGWNGDGLTVYARGEEHAYVWVTRWESRTDAAQFRRAYLELLRGHGAERVARETWVIPSGGYADAFRVSTNGTRVRIVNAPDRGSLGEVAPDTES